jgi:hypothetical protein
VGWIKSIVYHHETCWPQNCFHSSSWPPVGKSRFLRIVPVDNNKVHQCM